MSASPAPRVLVAIPAYNEESTLETVVARVRATVPAFDLLVVNDGSRDDTEHILTRLNVCTATHYCNLGYGRAIQTALKYADRFQYDALITLDADGQHQPEELHAMYAAFQSEQWDCLIGSRFLLTRSYNQAPLGRRLGMKLFSAFTWLATGQRIYDTTSGLKIIRRRAFPHLIRWPCLDFHAEAIVYLSKLGFRIGEYPINVAERRFGTSMYSLRSTIEYPIKTAFLLLLGLLDASLAKKT